MLQRRTGYFGGVEYAHFDHVAVFAGTCVVTVVAFAFQHFVHDYARLAACVGNDLAQRRLNGTQDDLYACVLVGIASVQVFQSGTGAQQGYAAACNHAFFNGCAGSVQRVFHAVFFLFHFDFGSGTDFNHCHAACQFGNALLQFFFVVIAGCGFDLLADFGNTRFDLGSVAEAVDDGGVFFTDFDAFGLT